MGSANRRCRCQSFVVVGSGEGGARDGVGMGAAATGGSCVARTNQTTVIFVVAGNILFGFLLLLFAAERASHFFLTFGLFVTFVCVCVRARVSVCVGVLPNGGWLPKLTTVERAVQRELN